MTPHEILANNDALLRPFVDAEGLCREKAKRHRRLADAGLSRDYEAAQVAVASALALLKSAILAEHRTLAADRAAIMDCG